MKYLGFFTLGLFWSISCSATQQFPVRKPGLWEIALGEQRSPRESSVTVRQCVDKANDAQILLSIVPGQENCGKANIRRQGGQYKIANRCMVHGKRVDMSMELAGDLQQRYEGRYLVKYAGKQQDEARTFNAHWVGDCGFDVKPGDMILPNGISVNVIKKHDHD